MDGLKHSEPMLSLKSVFKVPDLTGFVRGTMSPGAKWIIEHKLDGMAIALRYDKSGQLKIALSRGNGFFGEDITNAARRNIRNLLTVVDNVLGQSFEVRGEALLPKSVSTPHSGPLR
jgi:DNA ligase (NAD+)